MFSVFAIAEDITIHVIETRPPGSPSTIDPDAPPIPSVLRLTAADFISGKQHTVAVTHLQLGAILALMHGGDDFPEETVAALYQIAEPVVARFPQECRMIP